MGPQSNLDSISVSSLAECHSKATFLSQVDEKCLKALIHKGRAFTYLKEFDHALEQFEQAKTVDPKQVALIDGESSAFVDFQSVSNC